MTLPWNGDYILLTEGDSSVIIPTYIMIMWTRNYTTLIPGTYDEFFKS